MRNRKKALKIGAAALASGFVVGLCVVTIALVVRYRTSVLPEPGPVVLDDVGRGRDIESGEPGLSAEEADIQAKIARLKQMVPNAYTDEDMEWLNQWPLGMPFGIPEPPETLPTPDELPDARELARLRSIGEYAYVGMTNRMARRLTRKYSDEKVAGIAERMGLLDEYTLASLPKQFVVERMKQNRDRIHELEVEVPRMHGELSALRKKYRKEDPVAVKLGAEAKELGYELQVDLEEKPEYVDTLETIADTEGERDLYVNEKKDLRYKVTKLRAAKVAGTDIDEEQLAALEAEIARREERMATIGWELTCERRAMLERRREVVANDPELQKTAYSIQKLDDSIKQRIDQLPEVLRATWDFENGQREMFDTQRWYKWLWEVYLYLEEQEDESYISSHIEVLEGENT